MNADEEKSSALEKGDLSSFEIGLIEVFIEMGQLFGFPKSLGEIYGLLYVSEEPLAMNDIVGCLGISIGSASQGLKQLKAFRAVKLNYVPGSRKDYYTAEPEFRKIMAGFFAGEITPKMESIGDRLLALEGYLSEVPEQRRDHLMARYERVKRWRSHGTGFMGKLLTWIGLKG